jgi:hypothetical protein
MKNNAGFNIIKLLWILSLLVLISCGGGGSSPTSTTQTTSTGISLSWNQGTWDHTDWQ